MCVCDGFKPFISSPSPPAACAAACTCAACACAACAAALFRRRPPPAPDRLLGGLPARPGPAPAVAPCEAVGSPVVCIGRLLAAEAIGWSASPGVSSPAHVRLSGESGMSKSFRPEAGSEWPTSPRPPVFSRTASVSKPSPKRSFKNIDSESAFSMPSSIFECCTCAFLGARSPCPCDQRRHSQTEPERLKMPATRPANSDPTTDCPDSQSRQGPAQYATAFFPSQRPLPHLCRGADFDVLLRHPGQSSAQSTTASKTVDDMSREGRGYPYSFLLVCSLRLQGTGPTAKSVISPRNSRKKRKRGAYLCSCLCGTTLHPRVCPAVLHSRGRCQCRWQHSQLGYRFSTVSPCRAAAIYAGWWSPARVLISSWLTATRGVQTPATLAAQPAATGWPTTLCPLPLSSRFPRSSGRVL